MKAKTALGHLRGALEHLYGFAKCIVFGPEGAPSPLGIILLDPAANKELHEFLLGNPDKNLPTTISVSGKTYEVGIVSINPAPTINTSHKEA